MPSVDESNTAYVLLKAKLKLLNTKSIGRGCTIGANARQEKITENFYYRILKNINSVVRQKAS